MTGWVLVKDAPLGVLGHLWHMGLMDRTDALGSVYEYDDGSRGFSSSFHGHEFTHWHPLPEVPK